MFLIVVIVYNRLDAMDHAKMWRQRIDVYTPLFFILLFVLKLLVSFPLAEKLKPSKPWRPESVRDQRLLRELMGVEDARRQHNIQSLDTAERPRRKSVYNEEVRRRSVAGTRRSSAFLDGLFTTDKK